MKKPNTILTHNLSLKHGFKLVSDKDHNGRRTIKVTCPAGKQRNADALLQEINRRENVELEEWGWVKENGIVTVTFKEIVDRNDEDADEDDNGWW